MGKVEINNARIKASCHGKQQHKSMVAAEYILDRMQGFRGRDKSRELEIYRCDFCGFLHIGRLPKALPKKRNNDNKNR